MDRIIIRDALNKVSNYIEDGEHEYVLDITSRRILDDDNRFILSYQGNPICWNKNRTDFSHAFTGKEAVEGLRKQFESFVLDGMSCKIVKLKEINDIIFLDIEVKEK